MFRKLVVAMGCALLGSWLWAPAVVAQRGTPPPEVPPTSPPPVEEPPVTAPPTTSPPAVVPEPPPPAVPAEPTVEEN
ncbi:MAG: hypothetical protein ACRD0C_05555, partial [Acidimicrobiia bacterium]